MEKSVRRRVRGQLGVKFSELREEGLGREDDAQAKSRPQGPAPIHGLFCVLTRRELEARGDPAGAWMALGSVPWVPGKAWLWPAPPSPPPIQVTISASWTQRTSFRL